MASQNRVSTLVSSINIHAHAINTEQIAVLDDTDEVFADEGRSCYE